MKDTEKTLVFKEDAGFTLLEVIVSLILIAIVGTMLVQITGSRLIGSAKAVRNGVDSVAIRDVMETITADYRKISVEKGDRALTTLQARIDANKGKPDGLYGNYQVITNGFVKILEKNGSFAVVADDTGDNTILRVTVSRGGPSLTALFTR